LTIFKLDGVLNPLLNDQ